MKLLAKFGAVLLLMFSLSVVTHAQGAAVISRSTTFTATGAGASIPTSGTPVKRHVISWWGTGTVSTCQVKLEQAKDNATWTDMLAATDCTTNNTNKTTVDTLANFVRINVTTLSGGGTITVRYDGYDTVVTAGGGGGSTILTDLPDSANLLAWYQIKPTETNTAILDYSGHANTATGSQGTAPTIVALTGGLACNAAGGILLPASLNAAKTIMVFMSAGTAIIQRGAMVTGNGTTWSSLYLFQQANSNMLSPSANDSAGATANTRNSFWGTGTVAVTMNSPNNKVYQNGIEWTQNYFATVGSSSGVQTDGVYSICGSQHSTSSGYMNTGNTIYQVAFWGAVETAAQMAAADAVMTNLEVAAGVYKAQFNNTSDTTYQLLGTGDSIGAGAGITVPVFANSSSTGSLRLDDTWSQTNLATSGFLASNIASSVPAFISQLRPQATQNINAIWSGTNDIAAGTSATNVVGYLANNCRQTKVAITAAKCLTFTMLSRTGFDAGKNTFDNLLRQKWFTFSDANVDVASDPNLGADGASANTLYFLDGIHPTQHSSYNDLTPMLNRALNRIYGPQSFSEATTYVAAAAAAAAVTATSQATNTMTFTTALNPGIGSVVSCTGITPAGYNSPNTGWLVLTSNGATFTAWNGTTGLGAGSVFGTCSKPLQADKDAWVVLNFGAGNYTLQSCMGYTGQNIYIKNINASASTVVPFAAETIDGAASVSIATKATLIIQSTLVSSAASGCNWRQLQNN